ncbi:TlpA family protein disulfide reductase [Sporomusa termitida]|uniref:Thiol-disulfide oxidoreductase ResA n=1 Tax=Sporomusa termitida TaxID=2377 RepID=A0A517DS37_9FIRM|nr:TlpA disulfide reductase family protein [Sporomusa termitida]QDR80170.1 Thiol-disulfide oxidoreductase ResA [Sporomusa termitida]
MPKRLIILAITVIAMTIAIGFVAMQPANVLPPETNKPAVDTGVIVGKVLPGFTLAAVDGKPVTVTPAGRIIVLNFWATWCPPCREEMPELNAFSEKHGGNVSVYLVNVQESQATVANFLNQNQYNMSCLLDTDGTVAKTFRINAIPTTLVVDKQGLIKYRKSGPVTMAELEGVLNGL